MKDLLHIIMFLCGCLGMLFVFFWDNWWYILASFVLLSVFEVIRRHYYGSYGVGGIEVKAKYKKSIGEG